MREWVMMQNPEWGKWKRLWKLLRGALVVARVNAMVGFIIVDPEGDDGE